MSARVLAWLPLHLPRFSCLKNNRLAIYYCLTFSVRITVGLSSRQSWGHSELTELQVLPITYGC